MHPPPRSSRRPRRLAAATALVWLVAALPAAAGLDPLGNAKGQTKAELVVPAANADLSAERVDCDVFGWNEDFTEVAAVGSQISRGPRGKHRGHVFLLVYEVGEMVPMHNVNVHVITHVDLPHDPVPLDDARDLMTNIEGPFLQMWPRRPHRKRPPHAMEVTPLWYPVAKEHGMCTPAIGFALHYRGEKRFQPFGQVDMQVHCGALTETDARTYWGRADVAATMMRWDFSGSRSNERSARFVASAAWRRGRQVRLTVAQSLPLEGAADTRLRRTLAPLGVVHWRKELLRSTPEGDAGVQEVAVRAGLEPLGEYLAYTLEAPDVATLPGGGRDDVVIRVGPPPPGRARRAPATGGAAAGSADGNVDGGRGADSGSAGSDGSTGSDGAGDGAARKGAAPSEAAAGAGPDTSTPADPNAPATPPRPRYLDDWQMPAN